MGWLSEEGFQLWSSAAGPSYDAASTTYFAAMSVQPDSTRKGLIDTLITGLKSDGVWAKLDLLYLIAAHDAQAARLNAITPASYALTATNSPTFTTDLGYAGNGTTSYLATGWLAGTNGINFAQNSACFGVWVNAGAITQSNSAASGSSGSALVVLRSTTDTLRGHVTSGGTDFLTGGAGVTTRLGCTSFDRSTSSLTTGYRNGVSNGTTTQTSAAPTTLYQALLGAYNSVGTPALFNDNRFAAAWAGSSLGGTMQTALYNRLNTFLTAIGAN